VKKIQIDPFARIHLHGDVHWKAVADCQGICLVIARFQVRCPVGAFTVTQLLNREHIVIRPQLKNSSIADVVIPHYS